MLPKTGCKVGSPDSFSSYTLLRKHINRRQTHLRPILRIVLACIRGSTYPRLLARESRSSSLVILIGSKPSTPVLATRGTFERKSLARGGVCSKHWSTEFMKQVLPRL
jgi:hypothetical protein